METKRKKRLFNILMILMVIIIGICGALVVGSQRGWFQKSKDSYICSKTISGVVNIERNGVGYSLKKGLALEDGDIIETKQGALAELSIGQENTLVLNENTEIVFVSAKKEKTQIRINRGEIFGDTADTGKRFQIELDGNRTVPDKSIYSAGVQDGTVFLNLYAGAAEFTDDKTSETLKAGETLKLSKNGKNTAEISISELSVDLFSDFEVGQLQKCEDQEGLFFTMEELQKTKGSEKQTVLSEETNSDKESAEGASECTIEIRCDTILDNMDALADGKEGYVPSDGCILVKSTVKFTEGDTVFDILERSCSSSEIQLEYAWTPVYDSYYIEGINNLYEFDCGNESGWMFSVNGKFPNYGCSSYEVSEGDEIIWSYTCKGLGADLDAKLGRDDGKGGE